MTAGADAHTGSLPAYNGNVTNLYIDVDGVLLGNGDLSAGPQVSFARYTKEFLEFALANFDCYWLTSHCKGDAQRLLDYLGRFADKDVAALLVKIRPTNFDMLKTEALQGDFYWLDDAPLQAELNWLREQNVRDRWIHVDVCQHPDDLMRAMGILQTAIEKRQCTREAHITIRPFEPKDQPAARSLILAGLGDHFGVADPTKTPDLADMSDYVKAGHVVVVAEDGQEMVGTGILKTESVEVGRLIRMSVSSKHRRKRIGSALVTHLLDVAKGKGMSTIVIETNNDWGDAIGLYLRCGFKEDGRNDKDIFLSKQL